METSCRENWDCSNFTNDKTRFHSFPLQPHYSSLSSLKNCKVLFQQHSNMNLDAAPLWQKGMWKKNIWTIRWNARINHGEWAAPVSATQSRELTPGWKLPLRRYRLIVNGCPLLTMSRSTPLRSVRWSVLLNSHSRFQRSMSRALTKGKQRHTKRTSVRLLSIYHLQKYGQYLRDLIF